MSNHWVEAHRRTTDVSQSKEESTGFLHGLKHCWSNVQLAEGCKRRIHLGCQREALGTYFPSKQLHLLTTAVLQIWSRNIFKLCGSPRTLGSSTLSRKVLVSIHGWWEACEQSCGTCTGRSQSDHTEPLKFKVEASEPRPYITSVPWIMVRRSLFCSLQGPIPAKIKTSSLWNDK